MSSHLFGFLPMVPLPDWFAQLHPNFVSVHMVFTLLGVMVLFYLIWFILRLLFLCAVRAPGKKRQEVIKEGGWYFFWGVVFGLFGLYTVLLMPIIFGAIMYRESRLKYSRLK